MGSFIDDRCPTVWALPIGGAYTAEFRPRRGHEPQHAGAVPPTPAVKSLAAFEDSFSEAPASEARIKPIDGGLLKKLYKATVDERRRSAQADKVNNGEGDNAADAFPERGTAAQKGFYIPRNVSGGNRVGEKGTQKEKPPVQEKSKGAGETARKGKIQRPDPKVAQPDPESAKSIASTRSSTTIRIKGKNGEEAFVEISNLPLAMVAEEAAPEPKDEPQLTKQQQQHATDPKQTKQQKKKNKQQQQQNEEDRAAAAATAAEALMSGALPDGPQEIGNTSASNHSAQASGGGWEGILDAHVSSHSKVRESCRSLQPTVESAVPSKAHSEVPQPAMIFEEVGEGWTGPAASNRSSKSAKSTSKSQQYSLHGFEEVQDQWPMPETESKSLGGKADSKAASSVRARSAARSKAISAYGFGGTNDGWIEQSPVTKTASVRSVAEEHLRAASRRSCQSANVQWNESASQRSVSKKSVGSENFDVAWNIHPAVVNEDEWGGNGTRQFSSRRSERRSIQSSANASWLQIDPERSNSARLSAGKHSRASSHHTRHLNDPLEHQAPIYDATAEPKGAAESSAGMSSRHSRHSRRTVSQNVAVDRYSRPPSGLTFEEVGSGWREIQEEHAPSPLISAQGWAANDVSAGDWRPVSHIKHQPHSAASSQPSGRGARRSERSEHSVAKKRASQGSSTTAHIHSTRPSKHGWKEVSISRKSSKLTRTEPFPAFGIDESGSRAKSPVKEPYERPPTVFAGKGWISPHPLSRSPTEMASPPQSKIILPSEAFPQGATMTYEEWKDMQERGLRMHRNFSHTESSHGRTAKLADRRYKFAGWGGEYLDRERFEGDLSEQAHSAAGTTSYRAPTVEITGIRKMTAIKANVIAGIAIRAVANTAALRQSLLTLGKARYIETKAVSAVVATVATAISEAVHTVASSPALRLLFTAQATTSSIALPTAPQKSAAGSQVSVRDQHLSGINAAQITDPHIRLQLYLALPASELLKR
ncbi:Hypothetical predicted protein [Lecanosticta acicola]|uniref:Uncharacterized protein n=1 Tax=Lecanosticta acicola TaxID=111012 RepID=A0AAI8YZ58_9PEZI|nr:Hypothetical predicted protein [Lecanosticta acicola]